MSFKKRLTAALILVAVIISCLPVTANAAGTTYKEIKDLTIQYRVTGESSYKNYAASARFSGMDGLIIRSKNKPYFLSYKCRDASHGWLDSIYSINSTKDDFAGWPGYSVTNYSISILGTYSGPVVLYRAYVAGEWLDWVSNAPSAAKTVMSSFGISGTLDTAATDAGWSTRGVITGIEIRLFEPVVNYPKPSKTAKIITAPYIFQYYDYPNGCESVSAVMALQYCGYNISVATFIDKYLPRGSTPTVGGTGPDPDQVYCGDPRSFSGWGCFAPVIKTAVSKYVNKNDYTAACVEGKSMEELCRLYIDNGIPVITWVTVDMKMMSSSTVYATWTTSAGKTVKYPRNLHCMLLVGYDDEHYIFNDPWKNNGVIAYDKKAVIDRYKKQHSQAVGVIKK